jgi:hypothetical protein
MTVSTVAVITLNPGTEWDDFTKTMARSVQKLRGLDGVEDVRVGHTAVGGEGTNTIILTASAENWTDYGRAQDALNADPEWGEILQEAARIGSWATYITQSIEV